MDTFKIINVILGVLIAILAINLIEPVYIGNFAYGLDTSEPECYYITEIGSKPLPIDTCCREAEKQLTCEPSLDNIKCYTSDNYYLLNQKALAQCKKEGYNVN
jgi:hypothetical protein